MTYELVTLHNGEEISRKIYATELDMLIAKNRLEGAGYDTYVVLHYPDGKTIT